MTSTTYKIYTDGATSNNGYDSSFGGYAWVLLKDGERIQEGSGGLSPASNNICEMKAIISACQNVEKHLGTESRVEIYSDSAYCINCFRQGWYRSWIRNGWLNSKKEPVKNRELWEELIPYFEDPRFDFIKVRGHNGDVENEYVDSLAVKAKFEYEKEFLQL